MLNTTVTLTGSAAIALARNPRPNMATARRAPQTYDDQYASTTAGEPVQLAPQVYGNQVYGNQVYGNQGAQPYGNRQVVQPRQDDGYIYPADGSSDQQIYPAPRPGRRVYDAQVYQQQPQPRTYGNPGYMPPPPGYYYQQQQQYYQPRGYYDQN